MSMTEAGVELRPLTSVLSPDGGEEVKPVRRCKWCIKRTGAATYWHDGEWVHLPNPIHFFGTAEFTDGICETCMDIELARISE
jgi:hypothetical protein